MRFKSFTRSSQYCFVSASRSDMFFAVSSAMCVRYLLNNAYVCEGDILLHNPKIIQKYQYQSNYCGIKCDRTDDWCLFENKGRITGYAVGGENCHQMMGISYWTEEDGKKLGDCIKKVYEMPEE